MVTLALDALCVDLGRRRVVADVTATLRAGELIGVVGPNGAGKSTLVRAMLGLIPAAAGHVRLDDRDVAGLPPRAIATEIAYLPQGQTLHWPLSVERLVALGRLPHLPPLARLSDADRAYVERAMAQADVTHLRHRAATDLSGGERARAMLARALAVGAPGLIVDEPLAALDPGHQLDVMDLLAAQAAAGALVVTVLHDLAMAARFCARLLLMDGGRLVADGPPEAVLHPESLRATYGIDARLERRDGILTLLTPRRVKTS